MSQSFEEAMRNRWAKHSGALWADMKAPKNVTQIFRPARTNWGKWIGWPVIVKVKVSDTFLLYLPDFNGWLLATEEIHWDCYQPKIWNRTDGYFRYQSDLAVVQESLFRRSGELLVMLRDAREVWFLSDEFKKQAIKELE